MKKPTMEQCLESLGPLVNELLIAQVEYETTKQLIDAIDAPILAKYAFKDREGNVITDMERMYLAEADNGEDVDTAPFYVERADAIQADGWTIHRDYCPYLVIGIEVRRLQRAVVDALGTLLDEPKFKADNLLNHGMKMYQESVDLAVKLVTNATAYRKPPITKTPKRYVADLEARRAPAPVS